MARLTRALRAAGFPAAHGPKFLAVGAGNICNRGKRLRGAQLEITRDIRSINCRQTALIVRKAIHQYQNARSVLAVTWKARCFASSPRSRSGKFGCPSFIMQRGEIEQLAKELEHKTLGELV